MTSSHVTGVQYERSAAAALGHTRDRYRKQQEIERAVVTACGEFFAQLDEWEDRLVDELLTKMHEGEVKFTIPVNLAVTAEEEEESE